MRNSRPLFIFFSLVLFLVFIAPFIYISKFAHLSADDYCRAASEFEDYWMNVWDWYLHHNGRFSNAFFSYLPVYHKTVYKVMAAIGILCLGGAIFVFIREVIHFFGMKMDIYRVLFLCILFFIVLIGQIPSVFEFFYWYASTTAYTYSIIFFLLLFSFLLRQKREGQSRHFSIMILLVFLITGNNEILLLLTSLILLLFLMNNLYIRKKIDLKLLTLNIGSWIGMLIVYFSPGRILLKNSYEEGGALFYSLSQSFLSAGMFTLKSLIEFPYLFFYFFVYLFCTSFRSNDIIKAINPFFLAVISFVGIATVFFVPYYAIGYVKVNDGRIGNLIHSIFLIVIVFNLVNLSAYSGIATRIIKFSSFKWVLLFLFLTTIGITSLTYRNVISDFNEQRFEKLETALQAREQKLINATEENLVLEAVPMGRTIKYLGIGGDQEDWSNKCYTRMVNKTYRKKFQSVQTR